MGVRIFSLVALLVACGSQTAPVKTPAAEPESQASRSSTEAGAHGWSKILDVGCGFVLTESHQNVHFQLNLFGGDVRQIAELDHLWWLVDGVLVESNVAVADQIGHPHARGPELLQKYMTWETSYTVKQNGWPPVTPHAKPFEIGGYDVLSWGYRFPSPITRLDNEMTGIVYGAVAVDHVVFVMAAPLRDRDDVKHSLDVIFNALNTIKRTPSPLDVEALSRDLKSAPEKRWHGCPT